MSLQGKVDCWKRIMASANKLRRRWLFLTTIVGLHFPTIAAADNADVYRESDGRVARYRVEAADDDSLLRVVTFVELQDGSIQNAKVFYKQKHFTPIGVRDVEKPGRSAPAWSRESIRSNLICPWPMRFARICCSCSGRLLRTANRRRT